ncbi:MFS transporter [Achromobacter xylosoxidans]|uniref:MFS transporter n=1 Tax=Alcaligenes xylosoxydans xylosoxydans TaxID=85698 RepID=UPI000B4925DF|nr:MFS transporter [Achromobacter xylosoxidans]
MPSLADSSIAPSQAGDGLPVRQRLWAISTLILGTSIATLDTSIANTALPTIAADLNAAPDASIWIINAYQIAMVATLLPFAALGDIVGHRRVYLYGLLVFTLASVACGLADSLPMLIAARALQGVGASGILGVGAALIRLTFPSSQIGRAQGLNALTVAVSYVVGPSVASAILAVSTWHWLFLINIPLGAVGMAMAWRTLPHNAPRRAPPRFDGLAALLLGATFALAVLALGDAAHLAGWPRILLEAGAAALCCALLLRRQRAHSAPMLPLDLLRRPAFAMSVLTSILSYTSQGLALVALPFLLQMSLGRSDVATGLLLTPWPIVVAFAAPIAGYLSERRSVALLGGGLLVLCVGMALVALLPAHASDADIMWRLALCGAGFGFFQAPNLKALTTSAPAERSGAASGVIPTARLIGQASGAALVAACFTLAGNDGAGVALWIGALIAGLACVVSFLRVLAGE